MIDFNYHINNFASSFSELSNHLQSYFADSSTEIDVAGNCENSCEGSEDLSMGDSCEVTCEFQANHPNITDTNTYTYFAKFTKGTTEETDTLKALKHIYENNGIGVINNFMNEYYTVRYDYPISDTSKYSFENEANGYNVTASISADNDKLNEGLIASFRGNIFPPVYDTIKLPDYFPFWGAATLAGIGAVAIGTCCVCVCMLPKIIKAKLATKEGGAANEVPMQDV